ncbi:GerMN domain-containing protein [Bacillota bacterium LX-D]|nr:GerMN domain-containing protein [Bacillota bacterium LX-D]
MGFTKALIIMCLVSTLGLGCSQQNDQLGERINKLEKDMAGVKTEVADLKKNLPQLVETANQDQLTLYFIGSTETDFYLQPVKRSVPKNEATPLRALEELFKGPDKDQNIEAIAPQGTKLLSFKITNGIATVNLNRAFMENMNAGSNMEELILASIVNTLTEFTDIKKVQILIEGQVVDSIGGHVETSLPLERNEEVIKK